MDNNVYICNWVCCGGFAIRRNVEGLFVGVKTRRNGQRGDEAMDGEIRRNVGSQVSG